MRSKNIATGMRLELHDTDYCYRCGIGRRGELLVTFDVGGEVVGLAVCFLCFGRYRQQVIEELRSKWAREHLGASVMRSRRIAVQLWPSWDDVGETHG